VRNKAVYNNVGVLAHGVKKILGFWIK